VTDLLDQLLDYKFLKKMWNFRVRFIVSLKTRKCFPQHSFQITFFLFKGHYLKGKVIITRQRKFKVFIEECRVSSTWQCEAKCKLLDFSKECIVFNFTIKCQWKISFWTLNFCLKDTEPLKMKAVRSTEKSQTPYSAPQRHNAKEHNNWLNRCENTENRNVQTGLS